MLVSPEPRPGSPAETALRQIVADIDGRWHFGEESTSEHWLLFGPGRHRLRVHFDTDGRIVAWARVSAGMYEPGHLGAAGLAETLLAEPGGRTIAANAA